MEIMDYHKILKMIKEAASDRETLEIYYPATERSPEGWREIEPYSITTGTGEDGEVVVYGKEPVEPGHILNAYTLRSGDNHCDSFIIGKIRKTRRTGRKFNPRNNWEIKI